MKKIKINYNGSYVNTTSGFATLIMVIGILISGICVYLVNEGGKSEVLYFTATYIFGFSLFMAIILISISKILEHLLHMRVYHEIKANESGYEVNEPCYKITETKPEE